jgi:hypothetical protein
VARGLPLAAAPADAGVASNPSDRQAATTKTSRPVGRRRSVMKRFRRRGKIRQRDCNRPASGCKPLLSVSRSFRRTCAARGCCRPAGNTTAIFNACARLGFGERSRPFRGGSDRRGASRPSAGRPASRGRPGNVTVQPMSCRESAPPQTPRRRSAPSARRPAPLRRSDYCSSPSQSSSGV